MMRIEWCWCRERPRGARRCLVDGVPPATMRSSFWADSGVSLLVWGERAMSLRGWSRSWRGNRLSSCSYSSSGGGRNAQLCRWLSCDDFEATVVAEAWDGALGSGGGDIERVRTGREASRGVRVLGDGRSVSASCGRVVSVDASSGCANVPPSVSSANESKAGASEVETFLRSCDTRKCAINRCMEQSPL